MDLILSSSLRCVIYRVDRIVGFREEVLDCCVGLVLVGSSTSCCSSCSSCFSRSCRSCCHRWRWSIQTCVCCLRVYICVVPVLPKYGTTCVHRLTTVCMVRLD